VWRGEEGWGEPAAVATYEVPMAAREQVLVGWSGAGGEEPWGGYKRHFVERAEHCARRWLGPFCTIAGRLGGLVPRRVKGARSLAHLALAPADACVQKHVYGQFETGARSALYTRDFAEAIRDSDPFEGIRQAYGACESLDPLDRALYVDMKTYLVDDIMTKVDKMSMAVSLESREPLLDHKLLEFAATVPSGLKLKNGQSKYLLRRLIERRVPRAIVDRPKHGFEAPIGEWLRGPLVPMVDDLLLDGRLRDRGLFDDRAIAR